LKENVQLKKSLSLPLSLCVFLEHPIPISIQADDRQAHPNTPKRERERERERAHTQTARKKERKEGRKKERIWWMFLSVSLCALLFCVRSATTQSDGHTCICA
jgi:hypothetical protein